MIRPISMGKLCAGALLLILSNAGFAESFQDRLYIDATAGVGTLDIEDSDLDVEQAKIGVGFITSGHGIVGASYSKLDIEDINADQAKVYAGLYKKTSDSITIYGNIAAVAWDSSDLDDTESGFGVGAGFLWGNSNIRFKAGYEYLNSLSEDPFYEELHLLSLGIQYNFGNPSQMESQNWTKREESNGTSLSKTTACKRGYNELFPMCNPPKH